MPAAIVDSPEIQDLVDRIAGLDQEAGDARLKTIVRRVVGDLFRAIEELEVDEDEFWHALHFLQASAPELPLIAPGLGFDHFLDVLMDEADREARVAAGTPRTIEGPLYVEGAPIADGHADMTTNEDGERIEIEGVVSDAEDRPAGAIVDIWHANTRGAYSHFDPSQPAFNYRRRVRTGADGRYRVSSIMPSGYAFRPGARPRCCSTASADTATDRRTCTSSCPPPGTGTSRRRSTSTATRTCTTTSPSRRATS